MRNTKFFSKIHSFPFSPRKGTPAAEMDGQISRALKRERASELRILEKELLSTMIKQKSPQQVLFGTEAPGSGGAKRSDTGKPGDDLVPVIGDYDFLSDDDKQDIFYDNAFDAVPLLTKKAVGD